MSTTPPLPDAQVPPPADAGTPAVTTTKEQPEPRSSTVLREILSSGWLVTVLAVVLALVLSGLLIAAADEEVQKAAGYFFSKPMDTISAAWDAVSSAYVALFHGAVYDPSKDTFAASIKPLTETMTTSVPLILAGLGLGIGFRAGLFNIGAQGQIILGAIGAGWVAFHLDLPPVLHLLVAMLAAAVAGGLWAGIAGFLKARTGAHEVIVTIMLNNIAIYLVAYLLTTSVLKNPGSTNPISPPVPGSAQYPALLGGQFRLHGGFVVAVLAAVFVWWLMSRSTIGFKFRAVGSNAHAARTAGISVNSSYVWVMVVAGALAGLGGSAQVLGTDKVLTADVAASFGFDAITVALLGRSKPLGTFFAGLLFGALRAGGFAMQARTGTPIDVVLVVQSLVVLFIAAPPLVRSVFHLPAPGSKRERTPRATTKEVAA